MNLVISFSLSFLLWIVCFSSFITGDKGFTSDAISYYSHIKFFIENMAAGVYPLWDPYWHFGSPNEFFFTTIRIV